MFRWFLAFSLLSSAFAQGESESTLAVSHLAREADAFDRSAYRVVGVETLRQTLPRGSRISVRKSGVETVLPESVREIVSEYGFIALDERGGWLREGRRVLTVNGLKWNKSKKGLEGLARTLSSDDKKRRSLLESFEDFGLQGFVTDLGQLILLFARGLVRNYELTALPRENSEEGLLQVYAYTQLDGSDALTVYEGKTPIRQTLRGRLWLRDSDRLPVRISVESDRSAGLSNIRDISIVTYEKSRFGFLLPKSIVHEQFVDGQLFVKDEFFYDQFQEVLPAGAVR